MTHSKVNTHKMDTQEEEEEKESGEGKWSENAKVRTSNLADFIFSGKVAMNFIEEIFSAKGQLLHSR